MSADQHSTALRAYDDAVARLYGAPLDARLASVDARTQGPAQDEERVTAVVETSRALTKSTTALLESDVPLVRESGEAQLAALAARDIAIAFDVAQLEGDEGPSIASADLTGPALPAIERELAFVLQADPADGVPPSPSEWEGRARLAGADGDPRQALRDGLPKAIEQVRDDATEVVVAGLSGLASGALDEALGKLAGGLLAQLPDEVRRWYKWALHLLEEGTRSSARFSARRSIERSRRFETGSQIMHPS